MADQCAEGIVEHRAGDPLPPMPSVPLPSTALGGPR
jgi:hypothetical protein